VAERSDLDAKERFKLLLQSPPVIRSLVYREKLPPVPNKPVPLDIGIANSTNYALFEVRWQTNGMVARQLRSTNDVDRMSGVLFTVWDDNICFLDTPTNAFFYHLEHDRVRRGHVPPAYDAAWYRISRYAEVINLGLSHLSPGAVRWDGDKFSATGIADKKPMFVTGEIGGLTNGIPCELRVQYSNDMGLAQYRLAYQYDTFRPPFYPTRIKLLFQHRGKEIEYRTYDILSVTAAPAPLPEALFTPERTFHGNQTQFRFYTNDSIYTRLPSGKLLETPASFPKLTLTREEYYRNRYIYALAVLMTAGFLRLAVKPGAVEPTNQRKTSE
jgi:hypothetical protein